MSMTNTNLYDNPINGSKDDPTKVSAEDIIAVSQPQQLKSQMGQRPKKALQEGQQYYENLVQNQEKRADTTGNLTPQRAVEKCLNSQDDVQDMKI